MANFSLARWSQAVVRKAASLMFPRESFRFDSLWFGPGRTTYNYAADVQDGLTSSVVMPCVQWIMRAFPEAPLVVRRQQGDELEVVAAHPLVELVNRPNAFYPGVILWMATVTDWTWFGESYWRILRARGGQPAELWWIPPWSINPKWPDDGSVYISHYDYQPSIGTPIRLEVDEVIHFRHGLDPRNMRHGLPPLRAIIQDIWVDGESNNFIGAMLRNMGIPGLIISPKGPEAVLSPEEVDRVQAYIQSRFTGDNRGRPMALGAPTDVQRLSLAPSDLALTDVRNTAEERVCAALGIPAAVIGFGTGLANSKVGATMHEFIGLAWSNGIVPMQRLMAAELQRTLLPLFESHADRFQVGWDYDEVKALETDQNALAERAVALYQGGILMRAEARQIMGYEANDGDEIYLVPSSMTEEGPDAPEPEPLPAPAALPAAQGTQGNGNGNGSQNGNGAVQQRALTKQGGSFDEWVTGLIARRAPRMDNPPQSLKRLSTSLWRQEQKLQPQFQAMLLEAFQRYGELAAVAAQEILFPQKQNLEDLVRASIIHERIPYASITADLAAVYAKLYDEMVELTFKAIQEALELAPSDPARIQAQIQMISRERVGLLDLSTEARQGIIRILEESRQLGLDEGAMVDAIKDQLPAGRWSSSQVRAQIVARSEARLASNLSTAAVARDQGLRLLAFDGRLGPTDETCLPAGTTVVAIHPEKAFRRWFEGDLIDIETADGRFLSATGNHPILTRKGWVRADHLKEGDDVVCCLDAERFAMDATRQGGPDDKDMPASSHQGFNLSSVSFSAFSEGQPFTTSNLNSERRNSQVNTIATKSPLRDDSQATLIEPCPQELFIGAIELAAGFTSECRLDNIGMFLSTSENGSVSSTCLSEALFRSHMSIHKASRFGMSPQDISSLAQIVSDDSGTYTKLGANSFRGHAISIELPGQIDIDRLLDRSSLDALSLEDTQYGALADIENGRQLYRTLASQVTCDKIISIHIRPFVGHVYNLQTKDRWYIANNIITHNCEMRNGLIVSAQEAQLLAGAEHPNGTLGFAPISAAMMPSTT